MSQTKYQARFGHGSGVFSLTVLLIGIAPAGADTDTTFTQPEEVAKQVDVWLADEMSSAGTHAIGHVDDATYLRRVSLDLLGDLPTPEQMTAFVLDPYSGKRSDVVQKLLAEPQFGQNWARYWRDVILYRRVEQRALLVAGALVVDLTEQFNQATPWNEIARQFMTATGNVREDGRTAIFVAQESRTEETTAEMSRIFLGIQIQCAQCHDHVTDRWTRQQFHELAAFFPRVAMRPKRSLTERTFVIVGEDQKNRPRRRKNARRAHLEHHMPDLENPKAPGSLMTPKFFLTGQTLPLGTPDAERRDTLSTWVTASPWFAKAYVNRMWGELIGEGFYEPVDDIGPDRHCRAPGTIDYLADQFVQSGYHVKWLFQVIMATDLYQQTSRTRRARREAPPMVNCWQRLRADQLFNVLTSALEITEPSSENRRRGNPLRAAGPRGAFQLAFGYDPSQSRSDITGSIPQALAVMNSPQINREINGRSARTMLGRLLRAGDDDQAVIEELYLRCFAREPQPSESNECLNYVQEIGDREEAFEDILWALINSTEFFYRH